MIGNGGREFRINNVPVNDYVHRHGAATTLAVAVSTGDTSVDVLDASGFSVGQFVHFGAEIGHTEPIHSQITAIAVNNITLDRPIDNNFQIGDEIEEVIVDMSTDIGTLVAPISYKYYPRKDTVEHITILILSMVHAGAGDNSKFGDLVALSNGVVVRGLINGVIRTFSNWKTNDDVILDMYDLVYDAKSGGGKFGTRARTLLEELDVKIRLNYAKGDYLEVLIQDDIQALTSCRMRVQGHEEST